MIKADKPYEIHVFPNKIKDGVSKEPWPENTECKFTEKDKTIIDSQTAKCYDAIKKAVASIGNTHGLLLNKTKTIFLENNLSAYLLASIRQMALEYKLKNISDILNNKNNYHEYTTLKEQLDTCIKKENTLKVSTHFETQKAYCDYDNTTPTYIKPDITLHNSQDNRIGQYAIIEVKTRLNLVKEKAYYPRKDIEKLLNLSRFHETDRYSYNFTHAIYLLVGYKKSVLKKKVKKEINEILEELRHSISNTRNIQFELWNVVIDENHNICQFERFICHNYKIDFEQTIEDIYPVTSNNYDGNVEKLYT